MNCPITKEKIGLSEKGKIPCELCALVQHLHTLVLEAGKEIAVKKLELLKEFNSLEPVQQFEQMKTELHKLEKSHKRCAGCGLCFGGHHIAVSMRNVPEIGEVCQWCAKEIDRQGLEVFKKRIKK